MNQSKKQDRANAIAGLQPGHLYASMQIAEHAEAYALVNRGVYEQIQDVQAPIQNLITVAWVEGTQVCVYTMDVTDPLVKDKVASTKKKFVKACEHRSGLQMSKKPLALVVQHVQEGTAAKSEFEQQAVH